MAFSIKVDVGKIEALAKSLGEFTPEQLGALTVDAINTAAESAYELSRKTMLRTINLTDAYVQDKMQLESATAKSPTATITALGGKRADMTSLSHYGAMQESKAVNWSNARIQAMGKKFGKWSGWTRRTGFAALDIAADRKADGKSVEVTRGSRKRMGSQFSLAGKKDREGNLLIFRRDNAGKIQALMGPSVYQLFRAAATDIEGQVADDLEATLIEMADKALQRAIQ